MFRFPPGFIYVLITSIISIISSSAANTSYGASCTDTLSCINPLICSDMNRCVCSISSSFWNEEKEDCFHCPVGWIEWKNQRCLLLSVPLTGGFSFNEANSSCHSFSGELLHLTDRNDFVELNTHVQSYIDQSNASWAVKGFFIFGTWIDALTDVEAFNDFLCSNNNHYRTSSCFSLHRGNSSNDSVCLGQSNCNDDLFFICNAPAVSLSHPFGHDSTSDFNERVGAAAVVGAVAPAAFDFLGNIFGINKKTDPPAPPQPQQIIIQQQTPPVAQTGNSNRTTLYILLGVGGILLFLLICGACVGLVLCSGVFTKSKTQERRQRSSVESGYSYS